jgi:hypothetical protein
LQVCRLARRVVAIYKFVVSFELLGVRGLIWRIWVVREIARELAEMPGFYEGIAKERLEKYAK